MSTLNQPHFQDATKAREYLEAIRWPHGAICPHCGSVGKDHYELNGKAHRPGVYKCKDCRGQFTVTVGTVFERSKVPLHQWMQAVYLICSSKKGCSSHQLQRTLGVQYKTAWFMTHRLREAMKPNAGSLLGSLGGTVEADETFIGRKPGTRIRRGHGRIRLKASSASSNAACTVCISIAVRIIYTATLPKLTFAITIVKSSGSRMKNAPLHRSKASAVNA